MALTRIRAQQISNIDIKQAVRVVTTSNITLSGGAPRIVDEVTLAVGNRVLVNGQTDATQNGIYQVQSVGSNVASDGTWVRSTDANVTGEMASGLVVTVSEGYAFKDTLWTLTTDDPVLIGQSVISFQQSTSFSFGVINAGGTTILANTVGATFTFSAGNNIAITGNANSKTVTIGVSGIETSEISNGTSNVAIATANGNVTVSVAGTANVLTVSSTGTVVSGTQSVTGNILTGAQVIASGVIESGTGFSTGGYLSVDGSADLHNTTVTGNISATGTISVGGITLSGNLIVGAGPTLTIDPNGSGGTDGNVVITGNLTVNGTTTTINSNTITTNDLQINMANNAATATAANNGGIGVGPAGAEYATFLYNTAANVWIASLGISSVGNITAGNLSGTNITGTLATAAQNNITSVGTLTSASVSGNVQGGNLTTAGLISAAGSITGDSVVGGVITGTSISVTGSQSAASTVGGVITGTSTSVSGTTTAASVVGGVITGTSTSVTGTTTAASVIGGVITGSSVSVTGNVTSGNLLTVGVVSATGNITSNYFIGNGSQLTGIVAGGGIEWTTQANTAPSLPVAGDFWYDSYTDKKYQYTNDGVSNYWVDQSFPTSYSSLAVTGNIVAGNVLITGNIVGNISAQTITANVVGSVTGNLTGNVFGNLIGNSYGNSTGTHFGNVTGNLTGAVLTGAQSAITSVGTLSSLSVTGNITTSAYFFGDGSQLTGISSTGSFIANGTSNVSIATTNGNITATVSGTEILKITSAGIENSRANGVGNIGSSTTYFNTVFAKATSAQYADLAEMYLADHHYEPGTVLVFGGVKEVTISDLDHDPRAAGVVSTQPSYLMNSGLSGKYPVELALTGRVPCQVQGPVEKGDRLVNIAPGIAGRLDTDKYQVGCVIGKSLEVIANTSIQMIEIAIGRY